MAAQSSDGDFAGDQGCSDDGRELKQMLISLQSCLRQQYGDREKTYHGSHHNIIVNPEIPCQLDSDPDPQRCRDEGTRHKSPADGEEGPALAFIPDSWRLEGVFFHDGSRKREQVQQKRCNSLMKIIPQSEMGKPAGHTREVMHKETWRKLVHTLHLGSVLEANLSSVCVTPRGISQRDKHLLHHTHTLANGPG